MGLQFIESDRLVKFPHFSSTIARTAIRSHNDLPHRAGVIGDKF